MSHLFLFQIGPVQTFIAAARRTQDLLIGSTILSDLAKAGITEARDHSGFQPIFPFVQGNAPLEGSVSHKFAFISDAEPTRLADEIRKAIVDAWRTTYAEPVKRLIAPHGQRGWEDQFERQAYDWLEFYWVAVPNYSQERHADLYSQANIALNQRKQARMFASVEEDGDKCTLSGSQSALNMNWKGLSDSLRDNNITLRANEKLGSLALIKRLIQRTGDYRYNNDVKNFPDTTSIAANRRVRDEDNEESDGKEVAGYLAVLHMDGDQMGVHLSTLKTLAAIQDFSASLSDFSTHIVRDVIKEHGGQMGQLVYSGGDDVLALLPLSHMLECANEIRWQFLQITGCNMSAGIAITPASLPLDVALEIARKAEKEAKEKFGRNAVVVTEAHGTGQIRSAGTKWQLESNDNEQYREPIYVTHVLRTVQTWFADKKVSGKLGYEVQQIAHDLNTPELKAARYAEFGRVLKRRIAEGVSAKDKESIVAMLPTLAAIGDNQGWDSLGNWLILARFLASGGKREADSE